MNSKEKELALYKKLYAIVFVKADEALTQLKKATEVDGGVDLLSIYRAKEILFEALQNAEDTYFSADV